MSHVQGSRRVRRHELDVHLGPSSRVTFPVVATGGEHAGKHGRQLCLGEEEVDEPGPRNLDLANQPLRQREGRHEAVCDRPRFLLERLGEREGQIRRQVAVRGIARLLELDRGGGHGRAQPSRGLRQRRADRVVRLHFSPESFFFLALSTGLESDAGFTSEAGLDSVTGFPSPSDSRFSPARL